MVQNENLAEVLARMNTGNACNAPQGFARDLSLRKPEFWDTRPSPKVLWHWTEAEFSAFLAQHRFPGNTLRDREAFRAQTIRDALVRGDFIPREVMADAPTAAALADAVISVRASFAYEAADRHQKQGKAAFDAAIGYSTSHAGVYHARLADLLVSAARAKGRTVNCRGLDISRVLSEIKEVALDGLSFGLTLSTRTPEQPNRHFGQKLWIEVRDARYNDVSLYGDVHRIPFEQAEGIFRRLLDTKVVTLAEVRTLMGPQWQPYMQVTVVSSVPTPQ